MGIYGKAAEGTLRLAAAAGPRGLRAYDLAARIVPRGPIPRIRTTNGRGSDVDAYWGVHVLHSERFPSQRASWAQIESRFALYPLYREFFDLWGTHEGEIVLDFGCGPGNDLIGFAAHSGARRVIGMDVSEKALAVSADRLALHRVNPLRVELIQVRDTEPSLPLRDDSVDYIHCAGVLHHVSEPDRILQEFRRVLKPGGAAAIMVYNRDSVFFHLVVAYVRMILNGECAGMDVDTAFGRMTDGPDCPISIAYRPGDWLELCRVAGLDGTYLGGLLSTTELEALDHWGLRALLDERLGDEHREYLQGLRWGERDYPLYDGRPAGCGASFRLRSV